MAISATPVTSISGTATGTVITITLPTYSLSNTMVMFISSNNGNAQSIGSTVVATQLTSAANRLVAYKLVPINASQTSFTVTVSAASVFSWWIGTFSGVDATAAIPATSSNPGGNATSAIEGIPLTGSFIATGNELALWAGSVNANATWTIDSNTKYSTGSVANAGLMVEAKNMTSNTLTFATPTMDRGLNGTTRNESAATIILQASPNGAANLLANPSFEAGATLATSWQDEHSSVAAPTYSLVTTGVTDGAKAQRMRYTAVTGDTTTSKAEIYQAPVYGITTGDVLTFTVDVSGSMNNVYCFIGIEGFLSGGTYIDENDTNITTLTSTPTTYSVSYTCPTNTNYVAVYLQIPTLAFANSASYDITLDNARLTLSSSAGDIKYWNGTAFVAKPAKVWNGTSFVAKPVKVWNGTAFVKTNY